MPAEPPLWRRAFNRGERAVGRPLENAVASRAFNDVFVLTFRVQGGAYRLFQRQSRAVLHLWNLPTYADVTRLHRQVGALRAEIQDLSMRLEDQQHQRQPRPAANRRAAPL
jgi:hypothetical protein